MRPVPAWPFLFVATAVAYPYGEAVNPYDVEVEWGERGVAHLAGRTDVLVIVDVLSFSTCVDVAVARGATVIPGDGRHVGAVRAVRRLEMTREHPYSLSPPSLLAIPAGTRLALGSPNGATLTRIAVEAGVAAVYAGCLRNAGAVARAARADGRRLGVVAAGERWDDNSLRPAIEDLLGAGAVVAASDADRPSPEAALAASAFHAARPRLAEVLRACMSGRELTDIGFGADVDVAAEHDVSDAVPVLRNGEFRSG